MSSLPFRRFRGLISLAVALVLGANVSAFAHEGHDHGSPAPAPVGSMVPRIEIQSESYELVGTLQGDTLTIYLDDFATNAPVRDGAVTVNVAGEDFAARPTAGGAFALKTLKFWGEGALELVFSVAGPKGEDLLIGTLQRPSAAPVVGAATDTRLPAGWIAGGSLLAGFVLGAVLFGWRRRGAGAAALILAGVLVAAANEARAHEGHDHEAPAAMAVAGDAPQRLPDRSVFLPKASQRLLEIRTRLTATEKTRKTVSLVGRIIMDPNRGGLVQSIAGGRVIPAESGLPRLGQSVKRGDVLAYVEPALPQADRTTISERSGELEQSIAVAEAKLRRLKPLAERGITPQSQIVDAETELEGLKRRREIVRETRVEPEVLRAPADGVLASVKAQAGQVVQAQDVLFQIVDPKGLLVEALAYGENAPASMAQAAAVSADGVQMELRFLGYSRALQQQASVVHFAIDSPPDHLNAGQPVSVFARTGAEISGIIVPREAVVRGANGESLVWRHVAPERFEPVPVRSEPLDAGRLVVRAGVSEGERIVIRGADLINQVR